MYSIEERKTLSDVYLKCETGEILGLLGRNGCGKTILLKITFGIKYTDNKHLAIDGTIYRRPYLHKGLPAYLPQQNFLPRNISLSEIIHLYHPRKVKQDNIKNDSRIQQHLSNRVDALSKGKLRYSGLLLLLQLDVEFLLLDKPFSGVESLYVEQIEEMFRNQLHTKGFLITDHNYRAVLRVSHQSIMLADGTCRINTHPDQLIE